MRVLCDSSRKQICFALPASALMLLRLVLVLVTYVVVSQAFSTGKQPLLASFVTDVRGSLQGLPSCSRLLGAVVLSTVMTNPALAIDPAQLAEFAKSGQSAPVALTKAPSIGTVLKMDDVKRLQETQSAILGDANDIPYTDLPSGVSYREFRSGKGSKEVGKGSIVTVEMTARAKKLFTAKVYTYSNTVLYILYTLCTLYTLYTLYIRYILYTRSIYALYTIYAICTRFIYAIYYTLKEPGGVMYYSTKLDTPNNALMWEIGSGEMLPGLEDALLGMKRGAVRRVEVPSTLVFAARKVGYI